MEEKVAAPFKAVGTGSVYKPLDLQGVLDAELACRITRVQANRVFIDTALSGATLLWLEQRLRDATGNREYELLCEERRDENTLRRLAELRGKR